MNTSYIRTGNIIASVEKNKDGGPKEVLKFDSCNKAKKESYKMQQANGGLGAGYMIKISENKVYKPKPLRRKKGFKSMLDTDLVSDLLVDMVREKVIVELGRRSKK